MHLNGLADSYTKAVAAKRSFQVALVLFGDEGDRLGVNCSFVESLSGKWAECTEAAEWWVFSLKSKLYFCWKSGWLYRSCYMSELCCRCSAIMKWFERTYLALPGGLAGTQGQHGEGSPSLLDRGSWATPRGRSSSGPSTGSCFSAAALPLSLALATAPVKCPPCLCLAAGPLVRTWPLQPYDWLPRSPRASPWPWCSPRTGWTCLSTMVWAGDLSICIYPGSALLTWPWGWALPPWWPPLRALFLTRAAPGCLWLVFCKTSSWRSLCPMASEVARAERMAFSFYLCVLVFWFWYRLLALTALKFHLRDHEDKKSECCAWGFEKIDFPQEEKKLTVECC